MSEESRSLGWLPEQIERAHRIVNDIHEDLDNRESRSELRQALAIYSDLLDAEANCRSQNASEQLLELLKSLTPN